MIFRRFRRFFRLALCSVVIAAVLFFIKSIMDHFSPHQNRTDLRKHHSNFHIMSPITEPRGYSEKQPLFLLVIVSSSPKKQENADKRSMLRQTWGNIKNTHIQQQWKVVFMMGKASTSGMNEAIMKEQEEYGDLLIGDYRDAYRNITTKLLMAFQWASRLKCNYVLKTDDDVYIDIPKLIKWLIAREDKLTNSNSFYGGVLYSGAVVRNTAHRHYVSRAELPWDYYPKFCKGSMFVVSWNLIQKMVDLSRQVTRIPPDDAYIGILANLLGVDPVRIDGFLQKSFLHWFIGFISLCQLRDLMGIGDSLTPDQMNYVHQVKTSASYSEGFNIVCVSLHMKFFLLLLFCCTGLLFLCYRRCSRFQWWPK